MIPDLLGREVRGATWVAPPLQFGSRLYGTVFRALNIEATPGDAGMTTGRRDLADFPVTLMEAWENPTQHGAKNAKN